MISNIIILIINTDRVLRAGNDFPRRSCEFKLIQPGDLPTRLLRMRHSGDFIARISSGPISAKRVNWLEQLIPTSLLDVISSRSYTILHQCSREECRRCDGPGKPGTCFCFLRCTYIFIISSLFHEKGFTKSVS